MLCGGKAFPLGGACSLRHTPFERGHPATPLGILALHVHDSYGRVVKQPAYGSHGDMT